MKGPMRTHAAISPGFGLQPLRAARQAATVLIVDDDPLVRKILQVVLNLEGYSVVTAPDGPNAIELASNVPVTMLITDFQMPGMNGFILAATLAEQIPLLPVLMISGSFPDEIPLTELARRHWKFLPKPVDRGLLLHIVDGECLGWARRLQLHRERNAPSTL